MADTQIHPTGTVAVPADYEIPGSAELLLKTAYAHFDGSAAAGSFLPLIRIISDAGSTVVEAVADTAIAAGASADASWFPHLAAAASDGIKFDQPNTDPLGAFGALRIDTGLIEIGNVIEADWEVTAIDYQWESTGSSGWDIEANGGPFAVNANTVGGHTGHIDLFGEDHVALTSNGGSAFEVRPSGVYTMANLPTVDPGNPGQLWNSAGTLKVSP